MRIWQFFWNQQFLRFGLVGLSNTLCHGLLLTVMVEFFFLNVVLANLIAFFVANLLSYFMNSYVTFKIKISFFLYGRFFSASLFSLGLTLSIAWIMNYLGFTYLQGFAAIVLIVPVVSFIVMKFWAFSMTS